MGMESRKTAPVGVFDSGVGGLTVAREISRQLPKENIVYFGDTARVPYGSKSQNTIIRFSEQIIRFLKTKQVKAIVIACNTASALALDAVRDEFDIPIMGVVIPGARAAVEATKNRKVGVVGTDATVQSGMYTKVIREMAPDITVTEKACPLFVPLVEEGFKEHVVTQEIIEYYLESMKHRSRSSIRHMRPRWTSRKCWRSGGWQTMGQQSSTADIPSMSAMRRRSSGDLPTR